MDFSEIDQLLFAGARLPAIAAFRDAAKVSLQEAISQIGERFEQLAIECPERFTVPLAGYWDGVYT